MVEECAQRLLERQRRRAHPEIEIRDAVADGRAEGMEECALGGERQLGQHVVRAEDGAESLERCLASPDDGANDVIVVGDAERAVELAQPVEAGRRLALDGGRDPNTESAPTQPPDRVDDGGVVAGPSQRVVAVGLRRVEGELERGREAPRGA